jgi:hypothetical protein
VFASSLFYQSENMWIAGLTMGDRTLTMDPPFHGFPFEAFIVVCGLVRKYQAFSTRN